MGRVTDLDAFILSELISFVADRYPNLRSGPWLESPALECLSGRFVQQRIASALKHGRVNH